MAENHNVNNPVRNYGSRRELVSNGTGKSDAAKREEAVLEFWKENKVFEKSLEKKSPKGEFIFYEGPPTANGKPGIHHLEARAFKDAIPRYKTMRGFHVRRKGGWDTHGLPVELQVEKKLGLNSKRAIEDYGIAKFNQECKESVWEYLEVWNKFTKRIGFWIDEDNPYVTYHNDYIESVWNVVKKINDQNLLYKDYKVVPWCPRCGTALSSHELAQGYEEVKDLAVYVKFKIVGGVGGNTALAGSLSPSGDGALPLGSSACETPRKSSISADAYFLAWTTTPWTLPGNVALAVGKDITYVEAKVGEEILILAKDRLSIITEPYEILAEHKGNEMAGMEYEPLFPYLSDALSQSENKSEKSKLEKAFKVYTADFVNTEEGTGIVHTAVMYGPDDFELGTKIGLPKHHLVGLDGKFLAGTGIFEGRFVKDEEVAVDIIKDLALRGLLFRKEKYTHSYPHCWRCHTALIYYARDSWYIKMSDLKIKKKLISENKKINWEPEYIRAGRFGQWLEEIKDWAISRERYWGTPLPVWICKSCKKIDVIGSIADLKAKIKKSGNKYLVMRHGEAENNTLNVYCSDRNIHHLTENGKTEVIEAANNLRNKKITKIYSSPFLRARETAEIIADKLGFSREQIIYDDRIRELEFGEFSGRSAADYNDYMKDKIWGFDVRTPKGESFQDGKNRIGAFLYEIDAQNKNETILIVSHGLSVEVIPSIIEGTDKAQSLKIFKSQMQNPTAGVHIEREFVPLPHNENYELDLHKPYIDEIALVCSCGGDLRRAKEVMDVWLDSGAMPFAQDHYPFDPVPKQAWYGARNKKSQDILYPADFICEAIDQTRGWFYTLHAVGILMGRGKAYKNVICLGLLMDAHGNKMSKSVGNIVDPWMMIEKYGVDTLRLWMYSVNQPGESKNFDEKTVALLAGQVFGLLYNVLAFYELYPAPEQPARQLAGGARYGAGRDKIKSNNVLDQWIFARLNELIKLITESLDNYKLLEPVRGVRDFVGDLSTWYLRRSRDRIKNGDEEAKQTLYFVLKTLAKIMAPFAPFTAEDIWLKLRTGEDEESVHLAEWPEAKKINDDTIDKMKIVRDIVTLGLEARQKAGIKVRQPLASLKCKVKNEKLSSEYLDLIKDEINVKKIILEPRTSNLEPSVELDAEITLELEVEGAYRELVRALQDMRKEIGLTPSNIVSLVVETKDTGRKLIERFETDMKKTVLASKIEFKSNDGLEIKVGKLAFKVKIEK